MSNIKEVKLGSQGLVVPAIGLGCMGMTTGFGGDIYIEILCSKRQINTSKSASIR